MAGITYSYSYDSLHRLLAETNNVGQPAITYQYNAVGNITSRQVGSNTFSYTYHPSKKHAVSNIDLNGSNYAFTYDANGNMTSAMT